MPSLLKIIGHLALQWVLPRSLLHMFIVTRHNPTYKTSLYQQFQQLCIAINTRLNAQYEIVSTASMMLFYPNYIRQDARTHCGVCESVSAFPLWSNSLTACPFSLVSSVIRAAFKRGVLKQKIGNMGTQNRSNELAHGKETFNIYELNSHQRNFSLNMDEF